MAEKSPTPSGPQFVNHIKWDNQENAEMCTFSHSMSQRYMKSKRKNLHESHLEIYKESYHYIITFLKTICLTERGTAREGNTAGGK